MLRKLLVGLGATLASRCMPCNLLPKGLGHIGQEAFKGQPLPASLWVPNSVAYIGREAFKDCGVKALRLPESLVYVGQSAFEGCEKLRRLRVPSSVEHIGRSAFRTLGKWVLKGG